MPSDIAKQIVDKIFGDQKADAISLANDALGSATYDLIQQQKLNFAKTMGFELGDTAQDSADAVADAMPDGTDAPTEVEFDGRKPEDPPTDEVEQPEAQQTEEEPTDETDS
ncbi:gp130 [Synechococcus phage syn9]|jgi:hypothetical protein|uniref:Gp130 n=1 Tax=Synechococcus phage syn9 TaxID=382359 RepID=Q0QZ96_BPSYS|nr:gp130 [Synechococcus phage syn9]ABA47100.1 gp130 [Synechococcus phage syn9]